MWPAGSVLVILQQWGNVFMMLQSDGGVYGSWTDCAGPDGGVSASLLSLSLLPAGSPLMT